MRCTRRTEIEILREYRPPNQNKPEVTRHCARGSHECYQRILGLVRIAWPCFWKVFDPMEGCNSCAAMNDARSRSTPSATPGVATWNRTQQILGSLIDRRYGLCWSSSSSRSFPNPDISPEKTLSPRLKVQLREIAATPKAPEGELSRLRRSCLIASRRFADTIDDVRNVR